MEPPQVGKSRATALPSTPPFGFSSADVAPKTRLPLERMPALFLAPGCGLGALGLTLVEGCDPLQRGRMRGQRRPASTTTGGRQDSTCWGADTGTQRAAPGRWQRVAGQRAGGRRRQ
jgi:hypothetical protein